MFKFARRDISHAEVRDALRDLDWRVLDTAGARGFVDLVIYHPLMRQLGVVLVEVKTPKARLGEKARATSAQQDLAADGWPITRLHDHAQAVAWHWDVWARFHARRR